MFAHPRVWLALFAVLLLLPGCVQSTVKPVKEQLITSGDSDSRDTVIDIKVKKYEKLVREFPKEPRYRERLARLYWMNKDHRNALKYLDQFRQTAFCFDHHVRSDDVGGH